MNIKPLADRVLILPAPAEEKTIGGIIIPDTAKEKPLKGEVVAVGHGTKDEEMVLKTGDTVLYGKYAGTELEVEGTKYLIMRQMQNPIRCHRAILLGRELIKNGFKLRHSLLSPEYLLSVERWPFHSEPPDHYDLLSHLPFCSEHSFAVHKHGFKV